jgi:hypothetical protein
MKDSEVFSSGQSGCYLVMALCDVLLERQSFCAPSAAVRLTHRTLRLGL